MTRFKMNHPTVRYWRGRGYTPEIVTATELRAGDVIDVVHGFRWTVERIEPDQAGGLLVWFVGQFDPSRGAQYLATEAVVRLVAAP